MKSRKNKIYQLQEEIDNLENAISQAEKNNKIHFANRLKIIATRKKQQINFWKEQE